MLYKVWVKLEHEYNDIEADSEEEAFEIASDAAMAGGDWEYEVTPMEDDEDDWNMMDDIERSEYMRMRGE